MRRDSITRYAPSPIAHNASVKIARIPKVRMAPSRNQGEYRTASGGYISTMPTTPKKIGAAQFGDVVAAAFEEALRITKDPTRAATLAAAAVRRILVASGETRLMRLLATS